jgi:hypothetical protein
LASSLGKTVHAFADFDKNVSVLDEGLDLYISMMASNIVDGEAAQ